MKDLWAIVPAGGSGRRMQIARPKQYLNLHGKSVIEHTLSRLMQLPSLKGVVVAISPADAYWENCLAGMRRHWPAAWFERLHTVQGGAERVHSVCNALTYLNKIAPDQTRVLVHDAVRPCVRVSDIQRLIEEVDDDPNGGLLALPVADTLKRCGAGVRVENTVDREGLWRACTPQLFGLGNLRRALDAALASGRLVTDEASAMEQCGFRPRLVVCQADNIKLTHPQDLSLIEVLIPHTEESGCE
ncbi:MAG: 2-C-methyl-D-erythritol 4-phosphate cytidylyltransferase [Gammaproteobacteria bacterium]|nr:MAG: 2-C-methyl-D-erythritol 4-phosphate cytidylyltransferase [Gammaproteobacteria bacterium]